MTHYDPRPIGVFDSGIGGVTVLKALKDRFPHEHFLYLGDTARLPYGTKSADTIRRYSEQNIEFLVKGNVKAVVIACNSASSQVPERELNGIHVYNVIEPGAAEALRYTREKRIGVIGTRATVQSAAYANALHKHDASIDIFHEACPLFVPLAEEGWTDDDVTHAVVERYLTPLMRYKVDTIILGCTHYPILKHAIQKFVGASVKLVDSGVAMAEWLHHDFESGKLIANDPAVNGVIQFLATDLSENFKSMARRILAPLNAEHFQLVDIN